MVTYMMLLVTYIMSCCFRPFLLGYCFQQALTKMGRCPRLTLPGYCSWPFLLGYCFQQADQDGTLSPTDPAGILFPADSAGILFPAVHTEIPFPVGPDNDWTLSPTDPAGILFPAVLAEFPISMDPVVVLSPPDPADFDTGGVVDIAVVGEVLLAVPDVFDSLDVVAMVEVHAVQTVEGIPMDYGDNYDIPDPRNSFETKNGMPVYYCGDFNDSDCEDPRDLAYEDWVDWYNLNAPEGCCVSFPDDVEARLPNTTCAPVMMVREICWMHLFL